jgi:dTDP-4-amino-4,6-dideoxygalactose transaminase
MPVPLIDLTADYRELKTEIDQAITRVIASAEFVGGEEIRLFESELAAYVGVRRAVGLGNGSDALELALQALGVGPGDRVLTVPFTFAAPLEAVVRVGAEPVLADIDERDFTIDVDAAARALDRHRVKAIIAVHLYGHPADLDRLLPLARRHGAALIEDAAQAHGAWCTVQGRRRRVGSVGDAACFSFYPTKNLGAMGDGGALVTDDEEIARRVWLLANHGDVGKYEHAIANGGNSRLDGIQAAVLRVKLRRLDAWNARRRRAAATYARLLADLPVLLPRERAGAESVYHQYTIRAADRERLRAGLAERGIGSGVHYPLALHQQTGFRHLCAAAGSFPVAERCAAEVLCLPMSPHLDDAAIEQVSAALHEVCRQAVRS